MTFHASINTTFFQAVYGRSPPPVMFFESKIPNNVTLDQQLTKRDVVLTRLKPSGYGPRLNEKNCKSMKDQNKICRGRLGLFEA